MNLSFRPARQDDYRYLWQLHKATMKTYVDKTWGWDEDFQRSFFDKEFKDRRLQLILRNGQPVGALELHDEGQTLFLATLEIAPEYQSGGIGSAILSDLIDHSEQQGKPMKLRVLKVNPARQFYERFGFTVSQETETHFVMVRHQ